MTELQIETLLRIGAALLAGSLIGLDRSYQEKPAGLRTHSLVCVASAMLMLVTAHQWEWIGDVPLETLRADPQRIAQGIMTGIGFLGAGAIFRDQFAVRGLTTAASVWMTASLGILFGAGMYFPAAVGTIVTLATLTLLRAVEKRLPMRVHVNYVLRVAEEHAMSRDECSALLKQSDFELVNMSYELHEGRILEYNMTIRTSDETNIDRLARAQATMPAILGFRIAPTGD